jgi:hypothetical protein
MVQFHNAGSRQLLLSINYCLYILHTLGVLACLDGYMNIAMEQTEEYVDGQLKAKYGDCFIRGNNGEYRCVTECKTCTIYRSTNHTNGLNIYAGSCSTHIFHSPLYFDAKAKVIMHFIFDYVRYSERLFIYQKALWA